VSSPLSAGWCWSFAPNRVSELLSTSYSAGWVASQRLLDLRRYATICVQSRHMPEGSLITLSDDSARSAQIEWCIDVFSHTDSSLVLKGWAFGPDTVDTIAVQLPHTRPGQRVTRLPSADVELAYGPDAANSRFLITVPGIAREDVLNVSLTFESNSGETLTVPAGELRANYLERDPLHRLFNFFFGMTRERGTKDLLEIGSRARSGNVYKELIGEGVKYTGLDIVSGPNVDIVGDAHQLSSLVRRNSVDAIFSISTFEHLSMPWKVAIEMNRVMRKGAIAFIQTHQTWAVHEAPWDYWRFSSYAWDSLFNAATGFRVVDAAMGEPAAIVPLLVSEASLGLQDQPAFLGSAVVVEKISRTRLKWPVDTASIARDSYPN